MGIPREKQWSEVGGLRIYWSSFLQSSTSSGPSPIQSGCRMNSPWRRVLALLPISPRHFKDMLYENHTKSDFFSLACCVSLSFSLETIALDFLCHRKCLSWWWLMSSSALGMAGALVGTDYIIFWSELLGCWNLTFWTLVEVGQCNSASNALLMIINGKDWSNTGVLWSSRSTFDDKGRWFHCVKFLVGRGSERPTRDVI